LSLQEKHLSFATAEILRQVTVVRRVLLVGSTGVGKSSIIKLLTGNENVKTSDAAVGCTLEYATWETNGWHFTDTIGLNEGSPGTVASRVAAKKLVKFIRENGTGFSLIILVHRNDRISEMDDDNYHLFYEALCENKVPLLLAITHCDFDDPVDRYWNENKVCFIGKQRTAGQYGWNVKDAVCVCTIDKAKMEKSSSVVRPEYHKRREQSKKDLFMAMSKNALPHPIQIVTTSWLEPVVRVWNWIVRKLRRDDLVIVLTDAATRVLRFLGLSDAEIEVFLRE